MKKLREMFYFWPEALIGICVLVLIFAAADRLTAGGFNTAGGLCPDGVQGGDEGGGWTTTSKWKRLPMSEGLRDEQVSDKYHFVEMTVYMCNDGTLMGRGEFRPGKKGR